MLRLNAPGAVIVVTTVVLAMKLGVVPYLKETLTDEAVPKEIR